MSGVDLAALRENAENAQQRDTAATVSPRDLLALVEAVEAAQAFVDVWTGSAVGEDTFGRALTRTRAALAPFRQEQP